MPREMSWLEPCRELEADQIISPEDRSLVDTIVTSIVTSIMTSIVTSIMTRSSFRRTAA